MTQNRLSQKQRSPQILLYQEYYIEDSTSTHTHTQSNKLEGGETQNILRLVRFSERKNKQTIYQYYREHTHYGLVS